MVSEKDVVVALWTIVDTYIYRGIYIQQTFLFLCIRDCMVIN